MTTSLKKTAKLTLMSIVAAAAVVSGTGIAADQAHAATPSLATKVCGVSPKGKADSGATLEWYWFNYSTKQWTGYEQVHAGPGGCGYLTVPAGYTWTAEVWRNPSADISGYSISQICAANGYYIADNGYTSYYVAPAGSTAGHVFPTVATTYYKGSC